MAAPRPEISVAISPALLQLRRAGRTAGPAGGTDRMPMQARPPERASAAPAWQEPPLLPEPEPPAQGPVTAPSPDVGDTDTCPLALRERIRLRRDGARPLVFLGAALLEETDEADLQLAECPVTVRQRVALYLSADDSLVLAAQREIEGVSATRPMHLARRVTDVAQLPRLLAGLDPLVLLLDPVGLTPSEAERGAMETFFGQAPRRLMSHLRGTVQQ
ncbi:hypothetical protein FBT96_14255 [Rhodobacter capsulatus]|uniref:Uncharacterized protein n=1 Tax=Rhodobacter capsulatus TaxID=1061 RepID=A0A4U1JQS2_RHOCA|nr:hypothetical protein [Rhodobacter capsulatus]TKD17484.1 hypothetical protein FBT96_14255 [Rhodobacter capsulatus]